VFLHFFDIHFLAEKGFSEPEDVFDAVLDEMRLAVRFALLSSETVLIPAASYFESSICRDVIDEFAPLFSSTRLWLVAGGGNVYEFAEAKLSEYRPGTEQFDVYVRLLENRDVIHPPFRTRKRSSTEDLRAHWVRVLQAGGVPDALGLVPGLPPDIEKRWETVPERLGTEAFIVDYVEPILFPAGAPRIVTGRLHGVINTGYFQSYTDELTARLVVDMGYLQMTTTVPTIGSDVPYGELHRQLSAANVLDLVRNAAPVEIRQLADDVTVRVAMESARELYAQHHQTELLRVGNALLESVERNPTDLGPLLDRLLKATAGGGKKASKYQLAVFDFLSAVFAASLVHGETEVKIHNGRKRLDIKHDNYAGTGFFYHIRTSPQTAAAVVPSECKNYEADIKNPALNQMTGRFGHRRGHFGFLICRHLENRELMIQRCRDTAQEGLGYVIVLEDADMRTLADAGQDPTSGGLQDRYLSSRLNELRV
jgi:hypothetical protein